MKKNKKINSLIEKYDNSMSVSSLVQEICHVLNKETIKLQEDHLEYILFNSENEKVILAVFDSSDILDIVRKNVMRRNFNQLPEILKYLIIDSYISS